MGKKEKKKRTGENKVDAFFRFVFNFFLFCFSLEQRFQETHINGKNGNDTIFNE